MSLKITEQNISDIAKLSRIKMSEKEIGDMASSFGPILEMIEEVNSVELGENAKRNFRLKNVMREDEPRSDSSQNRDEILESFPEKQDDYLKNKKVL